MVGCYKNCLSCLLIFFKLKAKHNSPMRIEETQMQNNNEVINDSNLILGKKINKEREESVSPLKDVSPMRSSIITGKKMKSINCGQYDYIFSQENPNLIDDISMISNISYNDHLTPIRINSPKLSKTNRATTILPLIFNTNENESMPKLKLASPRRKIPRNKSQPACVENDNDEM